MRSSLKGLHFRRISFHKARFLPAWLQGNKLVRIRRQKKDMKPAEEKIQSLCTESSFNRGIKYLRQGRIEELDLVGEKVTAKVSGTDLYEVRLDLSEKNFAARCNCPYDWGGYCKHIVATLLKLSTMEEQKIKNTVEQRKGRIQRALENANEEDLRKFLVKEFKRDTGLEKRFLTFFENRGKRKDLKDYKRSLRKLYEEASDAYGFIRYGVNISFSTFYDLARYWIKEGKPLEAAKIYQAVAEVVAGRMNQVDDSTGYYGDEFQWALDHYAQAICGADLNFHHKQKYINYFFDKYIQKEPDYFQEYYEEALKQICFSPRDYKYWEKLLKPHLPKKLSQRKKGWSPERYEARRFLLMYAYILEKLNRSKQLRKLFNDTYLEDGEFCLEYTRWLKDRGKEEEAIRKAEEGLKRFGSGYYGRELRHILRDLYRGSYLEKYKTTLKNLYLTQPAKDYYQDLKKTCSEEEWENFCAEIKSGLSERPLIDFLLLENDKKSALRLVLDSESLAKMASYLEDVGHIDPKTYFDTYANLLAPYLAGDSGRGHYRKAITYLRELRKLGLKKRFKEFVEYLKEKNSNRPAFLDEMEAL